MRKFKDIIEDIKGLIGIELSSLSGIAAKITVTEVNEEEKPCDSICCRWGQGFPVI